MVGMKGKSGRHKRDCGCEKCVSRRTLIETKAETQKIAESDSTNDC
jgi:hypothetical protein